jgi:hypothetical protein
MSTAPHSGGLFRFLAVVVSASFIVLMLGTGSHADQNTSVKYATTLPSQTAQTHLRGMLHSAQFYTCASCTAHFMNQCLRIARCAVNDNVCFNKCRETALGSCNDLCRR